MSWENRDRIAHIFQIKSLYDDVILSDLVFVFFPNISFVLLNAAEHCADIFTDLSMITSRLLSTEEASILEAITAYA